MCQVRSWSNYAGRRLNLILSSIYKYGTPDGVRGIVPVRAINMAPLRGEDSV